MSDIKKTIVVHVIPDFATGGAEKVILSYLEMLSDNTEVCQKVIVLSNNKGRLYEKAIEKSDFDFTFLNQDIYNRNVICRLAQIRQLKKTLKAIKPDIVHIHLSILWIVCLATIGIRVKKIFHTLHSDPYKTSTGKNVYIDRFFYRLFRVKTICLNNEMKQHADILFKKKDTIVLHNGINVDKFLKSNKRATYRKLLHMDDSNFIIGHVGRFCKVKNQSRIVEIFKEIVGKNKNARLVLVGEGEEKDGIVQKCKELGVLDYVTFFGTTNDIAGVLKAFDVFLFPSLYEGLGIAVLEAQASNLRCVISSNIPEEVIATNNVSVLDLDEGNEKWAHCVLFDTNEHHKIITPLTEYDIKNVVQKLITIYDRKQ